MISSWRLAPILCQKRRSESWVHPSWPKQMSLMLCVYLSTYINYKSIYIYPQISVYIYIIILYIYTCSQFFCQHISVVGVYVYIYTDLSSFYQYIYTYAMPPKIGVQMVLQQSFQPRVISSPWMSVKSALGPSAPWSLSSSNVMWCDVRISLSLYTYAYIYMHINYCECS